MKSDKNKKLLIGLVVVLIIVGGFLFFNNQKNKKSEDAMIKTDQTAKDGAMTKEDKMAAADKMSSSYQGKLIAGNKSPYLEFKKADYEKAVSENKVIFLDFYANWCPICRAEGPDLKNGFNSLKTTSVVGFQVNWNDSDTDQDEKDLAKKYNITYQHTKVIVKDNKVVYNQIEQWDKDQVVSNLDKY